MKPFWLALILAFAVIGGPAAISYSTSTLAQAQRTGPVLSQAQPGFAQCNKQCADVFAECVNNRTALEDKQQHDATCGFNWCACQTNQCGNKPRNCQ